MEGVAKVRTVHGVNYYPNGRDAERILDTLRHDWPEARLVWYTLGAAVQLHRSGPYTGPKLNIATHQCAWCPTTEDKSK